MDLFPPSLPLTADADPGAKRRLDGHAGDVDDHAHIGAAPARHFEGGGGVKHRQKGVLSRRSFAETGGKQDLNPVIQSKFR